MRTITHRFLNLLCAFGCFLSVFSLYSQQAYPTQSSFKTPTERLWVNTYGNIRISKRLLWIAETHFRFTETEQTPFAGRINQLYNRHAIGYIYDKKMDFALGGVLRLNFNDPNALNGNFTVPEWRIWHQYQYAIPFWRAMIYHRIRIEHRWSKGFDEDASYIFRNRWRYLFRMKIPINGSKLQPKTWYFSPEAELIMQSGKVVAGSPMEDLRITNTIGYILNPRLTLAAGFMYAKGQTLNDPFFFNQTHTIRIHMYFSPDFRRVKDKLPSIHLND